MLVLSRKKNESIVINNDITVTVVEIRGDKVRLGIVAPKDVPVHRQEVYDAIHARAEPAPAVVNKPAGRARPPATSLRKLYRRPPPSAFCASPGPLLFPGTSRARAPRIDNPCASLSRLTSRAAREHLSRPQRRQPGLSPGQRDRRRRGQPLHGRAAGLRGVSVDGLPGFA